MTLENDEFWKIGDLNQQNLNNFVREPAHAFLRMVSILFMTEFGEMVG